MSAVAPRLWGLCVFHGRCGGFGKNDYFCRRLFKYMTKEEKVAYWLDLADYDIETAEG